MIPQAIAEQLEAGWITVDEARAAAGLNPIAAVRTKVTITLSPDGMRALDALCVKRGHSRSAVIETALRALAGTSRIKVKGDGGDDSHS